VLRNDYGVQNAKVMGRRDLVYMQLIDIAWYLWFGTLKKAN